MGKDYKELIIWQKGRRLTKEVYLLTRQFPPEERFGLSSQIQRAVVSIPSNIAVGFNRNSDKELIHFLKIAKGSSAEVETQLLLSMDLGYVDKETIGPLLTLNQEVIRGIGALISKIGQKRL